MSAIPAIIAYRNSIRRTEKEEEERNNNLVLMGGGVMDCNLIVGSDIEIYSTEVESYKLDTYNLKKHIPQDSKIISIQVLPYEAKYGTVRKYKVIILYKNKYAEEESWW